MIESGAFHQELNRKHAADDAKARCPRARAKPGKEDVARPLRCYADGLRSPGLQQELLSLESRQLS